MQDSLWSLPSFPASVLQVETWTCTVASGSCEVPPALNNCFLKNVSVSESLRNSYSPSDCSMRCFDFKNLPVTSAWCLTACGTTWVSLRGGGEEGKGVERGGKLAGEVVWDEQNRAVCVFGTDRFLWMCVCVFSCGRATLVPQTPSRDPLQPENNGSFNSLHSAHSYTTHTLMHNTHTLIHNTHTHTQHTHTRAHTHLIITSACGFWG